MGIAKPTGGYAEQMLDPGGWPEADENTFYDRAQQYTQVLRDVTQVVENCRHQQTEIFEGGIWSGTAAGAAGRDLAGVIDGMVTLQNGLATMITWHKYVAESIMQAKSDVADNVLGAQRMIDALENDSSLEADVRTADINLVVNTAHGANVGIVDTTAEQISTSKAWKPPGNALKDLLDQKTPPLVTLPETPGQPSTDDPERPNRPRPTQPVPVTPGPIGLPQTPSMPSPVGPPPTPGTPPSPLQPVVPPPVPLKPGPAVPGGAPAGGPGGPATPGVPAAPLGPATPAVPLSPAASTAPGAGGRGVTPASTISVAPAAAARPEEPTPAAGAGGAGGMPMGGGASGGGGSSGGGSGGRSGAPVAAKPDDKSPATKPAASSRTSGRSKPRAQPMHAQQDDWVDAVEPVVAAPIPVSKKRAERDAVSQAATADAARRAGPDPLEKARRVGAALNAPGSGGEMDLGFFWVTAVTTDGIIAVANSYGLAYIPDGVQLPEKVYLASADETIPANERARWATYPVMAVQGWATHHDKKLRAVIGTEAQLANSDAGAAKVVLTPDDIPEAGDMIGRSRLEIVDSAAAERLSLTTNARLIDLLPPAPAAAEPSPDAQPAPAEVVDPEAAAVVASPGPGPFRMGALLAQMPLDPVDASAPADQRPLLWFDVMKPLSSSATGRQAAHLKAFRTYAAHSEEVLLREAHTAPDPADQRFAVAEWLYWKHLTGLLDAALADPQIASPA